VELCQRIMERDEEQEGEVYTKIWLEDPAITSTVVSAIRTLSWPKAQK
jgi:hypothetical protein